MTTIELMTAALSQISDVLVKAEESWTMLNQNISQVRDQRISLSGQKQMLTELINRAKQIEAAEKLKAPTLEETPAQ